MPAEGNLGVLCEIDLLQPAAENYTINFLELPQKHHFLCGGKSRGLDIVRLQALVESSTVEMEEFEGARLQPSRVPLSSFFFLSVI
jgi:hypothetical protein